MTKPDVRDDLLKQRLKMTHESLRNSPDFLDLIIQALPDIFLVKDTEYRIVMGNQALLDMYPESQRDQVIGFTTVEQYPPEQAAAFLENDRIAFEEGESVVVENIDTPSGRRVTLLTRKIRFEASNGQAYIAGIARDITEVIADREALAESEQRYALAVAGSAVGIWDWNRPKQEMFWSDRVKEILRIRRLDFTPTIADFIRRIHKRDADRVYSELRASMRSSLPFDVEMRLLCDDASYCWVHFRGLATRGDNGKITRIAGSVDDITKRKIAESKLRRSHEQLEDFAHIASHDLKQPLRGIANLVHFINEDHQDDIQNPLLRDRLNRIEQLTRRSETMVSNLLEFSRLSHDGSRQNNVSVQAAVESALALLPISQSTRVEVQKDMPSVCAETVNLRVLFQNLISNGLKYNDSEFKKVVVGSVHDSARHPHAPPVFYVSDNGIGIDDRYHAKVFKIFTRLHHQDDYGGGTGVGMTIVRKIIERHNGEIWLKSAPGKGTTVYFTLAPINDDSIKDELTSTFGVLIGAEGDL